MNEFLFFLSAVGVFLAVYAAWRFFGKEGLFAWVAFAPVLANILTAKQITLFGLDVTMGTVLFASVFLAVDILNEMVSKEDAKKAAWVSFAFVCGYIIVAKIAIMYTPNEWDFSQGHMEQLLSTSVRISAASALVFLLANLCGVHLYSFLRNKWKNVLWLRNNVSTIVSNGLENFVFVILAFYGTMPLKECLVIALGTTFIEALTSVCDTPFLYAAKRISHKADETEAVTP